MAQRKLTEAQDQAELPELTPQQMQFVQGLLRGMTASDAYRKAYDTENSQPQTIWARASELKSNSKVAAWLDASRQAQFSDALITKEQWLARMNAAEQRCWNDGNDGAAVAALTSIGKSLGYMVEQHQDVSQQSDVTQTLKDIAKLSPDLAEQLAAQHGIEYSAPHDETKH